MAARNRPRGAFAKDDLADAHEERNMWSQIQTDIKKANGFRAKAADAAARQVELETKMGKCEYHNLQEDEALSIASISLFRCCRIKITRLFCVKRACKC